MPDQKTAQKNRAARPACFGDQVEEDDRPGDPLAPPGEAVDDVDERPISPEYIHTNLVPGRIQQVSHPD
jgi:hypothetical protein